MLRKEIPDNIRCTDFVGVLADQELRSLALAACPVMAETIDGYAYNFGIIATSPVSRCANASSFFLYGRFVSTFQCLCPLSNHVCDGRLRPATLILAAHGELGKATFDWIQCVRCAGQVAN